MAQWVEERTKLDGAVFMREEVDGEALLALDPVAQREELHFKFGPSIKLREAIRELRERGGKEMSEIMMNF